MMIECFYKMTNSGDSRFSYVFDDLSFIGYKKELCNSCGRSINTVCTQKRHTFVVEGGKIYPDFLQFCGAGERLTVLSKKAIDIFLSSNISGFSIESIIDIYREVKNKQIVKCDDSPIYYSVIIRGVIDYDYSAMFLKKKKYCPICGQFELNRKRLYPVVMDINTWDGNDICSLITFPANLICTNKLVRIVEDNKLTGFDFKLVKNNKTD